MSEYTDRLRDVRFNPSLMHQVTLNELSAQLEGRGDYDIPDPSHPFVALMESSTLTTSMGMSENEALLSKFYASMALSPADLYRHMSDQDFIGRFSVPAMTTYSIYLSQAEIIAKAVQVGDSRVRKLTIPRLTEFTVADTTFTMQYPIDIQVMSHGGLQITYDTSATSPIQTLSSNMVEWDVTRINREDVVVLKIPVNQVKVTTFEETINAAAGYYVQYGFTNQFYMARVFMSRPGGGWRELTTTHTDQVYDPLNVTAVLRVEGNNLNVDIPSVYFTQGLVRGNIRVDIYTTRGEIDIDLGSYTPSQFEMKLNAIDDDKRYVAPLNSFNNIHSLNPNRVEGGSNSVTFEELRDQVINNTLGQSQLPITHAQLNNEVVRRGYEVVTNIDHITNRQFIATRMLPRPTSRNTTSSIGCMMGQFQRTMAELSYSSHVVTHPEMVTILPSMLYQYQDGMVSLMTDSEIAAITSQSTEGIVTTLNQNRFLYSPFHYVLDGRNDHFDVRPYYIDKPTINQKVFVGENDTAEMQISIATYAIERTEAGFRITVQLQSSDRVKEIAVENIYLQLGYKPRGERNYACVMGVLQGGEAGKWIYSFDIETDYLFDSDHYLHTVNLSMFDAAQRDFYTPLTGDFDISFIVAEQDMRFYEYGDLDLDIQDHLLPDGDMMVVGRERLNVTLGTPLTQLWQRGRSLLSDSSYRRYAVDVPYLYEETVFQRDQDGQVVLTIGAEGELEYTVLHEIGDPVLNTDGGPRYRHLKGDLILNAQGEPELIEARKLRREYTMFLMDGLYYFTTDPLSQVYRDSVPDYITGWLTNDIAVLQGQLLEQSTLYLHPMTTFGDVTVDVGQDERRTVSLAQSISVEYYLTQTAYLNTSLREALIRQTRQTVSELLERNTISISQMTSRLRTEGGEDVIEVKITGLGGDENHGVVSIVDDAMRLTLGKRAVALPNQLIAVQDDIDIAFMRHAGL